MSKQPYYPNTRLGTVARLTNLGLHSYAMDEMYSPDTELWKSKVLDLVSPIETPQIATAPQRYWFDRSRYNNHGTIVGATQTILPSGLWVLDLDGIDDYISVADSPSLEFGSGNFTIEFWAFLRSTANQAFFHWSDTSDWSLGILYSSIGTNKLGLYASSDGTSWDMIHADPGGSGIGTITVPQSKWTHIRLTRSGNTWSLFQDDVLDISPTAAGTLIDKAFPKLFGKWFNTGYPLNGRIALPRAYNAVSVSHYQQERHFFGV